MRKDEIARALRENRRWRWQPGCLARSVGSTRWWRLGSEWGHPGRVEESTLYLVNRLESRGSGELVVPDLDDPATVGILIAMLHEVQQEGMTVDWPESIDGEAIGLALVRAWRRADGFRMSGELQGVPTV